MYSDQENGKTEDHEDSKKIKVPDPSMHEEHDEKIQTLETADTTGGDEQSIIEGAWADVLGSGQLKKKVSSKSLFSLFLLLL